MTLLGNFDIPQSFIDLETFFGDSYSFQQYPPDTKSRDHSDIDHVGNYPYLQPLSLLQSDSAIFSSNSSLLAPDTTVEVEPSNPFLDYNTEYFPVLPEFCLEKNLNLASPVIPQISDVSQPTCLTPNDPFSRSNCTHSTPGKLMFYSDQDLNLSLPPLLFSDSTDPIPFQNDLPFTSSSDSPDQLLVQNDLWLCTPSSSKSMESGHYISSSADDIKLKNDNKRKQKGHFNENQTETPVRKQVKGHFNGNQTETPVRKQVRIACGKKYVYTDIQYIVAKAPKNAAIPFHAPDVNPKDWNARSLRLNGIARESAVSQR